MKISVQGIQSILAVLVFSVAAPATAGVITLSPEGAQKIHNQAAEPPFKALKAEDVKEIFGLSYDIEKYYKAETPGRKPYSEDGVEAFTSAYETQFWSNGTDMDFNNGRIEYVGGTSMVCPACYLLVKNGNKPQYLFDLEVSGWNGVDSIELNNFYTDGGSISHVALFGKVMTDVPESSALILMGLGLIGLGMARRRVAR
ncbi:PEP-CTERM sorting domain-containing protein [Marinimicrobium locisalis]|uniref:PEP-CTERM sorting domain-containing protein n=1 Tax=Marinimicrobium locisalis TaxID=546022 RepID=UPI003221B1FA